MGMKTSKLFVRGQAKTTSELPYPQLPSHAASRRALITLTAASLAAAAAPSIPIAHWPAQHLPVGELRSSPPNREKDAATGRAQQVPVHFQPPSPPTTMDTAVSMVRELLETVKEASDSFAPLKTALGLFLKVWDVYDRTVDVSDDFIELASKLSALNTVIANYKNLSDTSLQKRIEAIATAINHLAEAVMAKQNRGVLSRASQSMGDVTFVKLMFRRVTSLLEVFQFEAQVRSETLLVTILERLDTAEQRNMTSFDAVQAIILHMNQQHSETLERYEAILDHLQRGGPADDSATFIKNHTNKNELYSTTDQKNISAKETELKVDIDRAGEGRTFLPGSGTPGESSSAFGGRTIITDSGNDGFVRRSIARQTQTEKSRQNTM